MWPFIYHSESMVLPTYIVINSLVFSLGVFWIYLRAAKYHLNQNHVLDVSLAAMIGIFVGARGFHILIEHPGFYWEHPSFVLKIWYGGFVFYGGVIGGLLSSYWLCRKRGYDFWRMGDLMSPVFAAGYAVGRLGCLAAGCCFGLPTGMPWGIYFPQGGEAPAGIPLHPTQIYSSLWEACVLALLLFLERRSKSGKSDSKYPGFGARGQLFGSWFALHGLGRAIVEQFRDDFRGPTLFNLSISTWISGAAIMFGIYIVATSRQPKERETKHHASTAV